MHSDSAPPTLRASVADESTAETAAAPAPVGKGTKPVQPKANDAPAERKAHDEGDGVSTFEVNSPEFTHKVDVVIGDKFRAIGAFACDETGLDPDGVVRVKYTVRIEKGKVSATNIKATGERGAVNLARCIEDSMQSAQFSLPRMPDFSEDTDLFIRVKTLKKYRSRAEFDD